MNFRKLPAYSPDQNSDALSVVRLSDARGANQGFHPNWPGQDFAKQKGLFKHRQKIDSNIHPPSQIRIQYSGELFAERELSPAGGERIAAATQTRKEKNEKNAFKHGAGSCGTVCMGASLGDDHNNDHD